MPENSATCTGTHNQGLDWQAETLEKVVLFLYSPSLMKILQNKLQCNFQYSALGYLLMVVEKGIINAQ